MPIFYPFTNLGLKQMLSDLLAQPDFLTVSRRDIVSSFLCSHLHGFGYVAMTHEELIVRRHYDFLGSKNPKAKSVDVFQHVNLFLQLGICHNEVIAKAEVQKTIDSLTKLGMIKPDRGSDGQAEFAMTRLANPELTLDEAVHEVRRRLE